MKFYNSKLWRDTSKFIKIQRRGLCEKCGRVGQEVHHINHLTPFNLNDIDITINPDNLMLLCKGCHNEIHGRNKVREGLEFDENGNLIEKENHKINI